MRYLGVLFEHTISIFVPAIVQALDYLLPVSNEKCKAEHFYDQVNSVITTIKSKIKEEKDWEEIDMENIFKLPDEKYLRMLFKQTMKTAEILVANWEEGPIFEEHIASYFKEHLVYKNNRLLDELTAMRVEQFYKRFQAKVYYISASGKHGHPHEALLNGLIRAAVAQRNECTILLSTGNVLNSRKLPDPNKWKDYVTFKYLKEQGYASIDPITGNLDDARVYVPQLGDRNTQKRVREEINGGSAVDFFKKRVDKRMQTGKIKNTSTGKFNSYLLFVNASSMFELQKEEATVNVAFFTTENDAGISVTYNSHSTRCYVEHLNFNADKYRLYDIDGEGHVYLYCLNNTGKLVWRKKQTKVEDAVLLVFDFSSTDGGSASSMSRIRSHFTQLVRTQHSCSEKTASAESITLDSYLQYCGRAQPSSSVKVETLLSLLMGPDMSQQFTSLKGLPLEMQSLIDNALTWTMEEATKISVTNEKVVRCAILGCKPSTAPTFADGNTSAENRVRNREP